MLPVDPSCFCFPCWRAIRSLLPTSAIFWQPQAASNSTQEDSSSGDLYAQMQALLLPSVSRGVNLTHRNYMRGNKKVCDMGKESHRPLVLDLLFSKQGRGPQFWRRLLVQTWQAVTWTFASLDQIAPYWTIPFMFLIPHMQISTEVIQDFSYHNTMGEFLPQRICLVKCFLNRKQINPQSTRWLVKAYVPDLQYTKALICYC